MADIGLFGKMLDRLSGSQDSVRQTSLWMIEHSIQYEQIVDCWLNHLRHPNTQALYRLSLLHLANDVIQISHLNKKENQYAHEFRKSLVPAFEHLRDACVRRRVEHVLKVWETRQLYDSSLIDLFRFILNSKLGKNVNFSLIQTSNARLTVRNQQIHRLNDKRTNQFNEIKRFVNKFRHEFNDHVNSQKHLPFEVKDVQVGDEYIELINEAISNLDRFVGCMNRLKAERRCFIGILKQFELHCAHKYTETKRLYDVRGQM
ncbi:hypothetical protein ACOME3_005576 [Neoechinorhynchus agilis]